MRGITVLMIRRLSLVLLLLVPCACGKYGPPLPPEALSPRAVKDLEVKASLEGVKFSWRAPESDLRGKDLRSMDGYRIYRHTAASSQGRSPLSDAAFELAASVEDRHVLELERLQNEARAAGKPVHRVKVDDALKRFEYLDKALKTGETAYYRIVPFNQADVEGESSQLVKVVFRAEASEITLIPLSTLREEEVSS